MANLPIQKSQDQDLMLMQTKWKSIIDPILSSPTANPVILSNINIVSGNNTINHKLQAKLQGYIITGMRGAFAQVYQVPSQTPDLTLILNASGPCVLDLLVY